MTRDTSCCPCTPSFRRGGRGRTSKRSSPRFLLGAKTSEERRRRAQTARASASVDAGARDLAAPRITAPCRGSSCADAVLYPAACRGVYLAPHMNRTFTPLIHCHHPCFGIHTDPALDVPYDRSALLSSRRQDRGTPSKNVLSSSPVLTFDGRSSRARSRCRTRGRSPVWHRSERSRIAARSASTECV